MRKRLNGRLQNTACAFVAVAALLAATSCGGGGSSPGTPSPRATQAPTGDSVVRFIITWPTPSNANASKRRRPAFLSNSTKSVTIVVNGGSPTTVNNPALSGSPQQTTVTNVNAPVGPDTFLVTAYDQAGGGGNLLAQGSVPFTVVLDAANTVTVTLNGNLAQIGCAGVAPYVSGTPNTLTMVGPDGVIALLPEDADGNIIIAPGTIPTLSVTPATPSQATVTSTSTANQFNVDIHVVNTPITLNTSGTNLAGDTITGTCNVTRIPALYVANHSPGGTSPSITIYPASATSASTPTATLLGSNTGETAIQFLAVDPKGNLFVSNQGPAPGATFGPNSGYVNIYGPGPLQNGNQPPVGSIPNLNTPEGLAFDSTGNLFVLSIDRVAEYPPNANGLSGSASPSRVIIGPTPGPSAPANNTDLFSCYGMTVDTPGSIYTACSNIINIFAPGASGNATPAEIESVGATGMSFSSHSWLDVAVDAAGNIYAPASNNNLNFVEIFSPGSGANPAATPIATVAKSADYSQPLGIFIDPAGNIYVANFGNNSVDVFSSMTTLLSGVPTNTISSGINGPYGVTVR